MVDVHEKLQEYKQRLLESDFEIVDADEQRPWGGFYRIDDSQAQRFADEYFAGADVSSYRLGGGSLSPKILVVAPRARLSWQYHNYRAEVWRVVEGPIAIVMSDSDKQPDPVTYQKGETIVIEQGTRHRLIGLDGVGVVAELWRHTDSSRLSNEDDIVRIADDYGR